MNLEFEKLYCVVSAFTYHHFKKRLIPFTDVEDVAIEAVEQTLREDEKGVFARAKNREHRYELMKNRAENHVKNAAKARRTQRALVSINAFDSHIRESERYDEDGSDREIDGAEFNQNERLMSDGGQGASRVRSEEEISWLNHFRAAEKRIMGKASDAKREYLRIKRKCGLSKATPRYLSAVRREAAREVLRKAFRAANERYHRELAAKLARGG